MFEYDAAGNVIKENDNSYGYDSLDRIISANDRSYAYDNAGNILEVNKSDIEEDYIQEFTYGADNQIDTFDNSSADYDADGNLLNIPIEGEVYEAEYDSRNRLTSLSRNYNSNVEDEEGNIASEIISSYGYNAENRRTSVTENGKITNFVVSPHANLDQVLMETDEEGNPTKYYVYGQGLILKEDSDGKLSVYHYDRRGSTIALTNAAGEVTNTYEYDIYGEILSAEGETDNRFLYNGKYGVQTDDSGLYHMRARYYNPDLKRFINRDVVQGSILEPQTFNRYAYVNGNPISYIDPFGLSREQDGNLLTGVWNFFIGDDLNTLMNPHASGLQRAFAGISLASNFIPGAGPAFKGFKVLAKGIGKWTAKALSGKHRGMVTLPIPIKKNVASATEKRNSPGKVEVMFNFKSLDTKKIMYNNGSIGVIPNEIRDRLVGKEFKSFDGFRKEFWKTVADSSYAKEFSRSNLTRMRDGKAPISIESEWHKSNKSYILHHKQPIHQGGEVYNLDNLVIVSPRMHQIILDPSYHFGTKGYK